MIRVDVTPAAARQIRALVAEQGSAVRYGLRVAVDDNLASRQEYRLSLAERPLDDEMVLPRHGFDVYLGRGDSESLDGVKIDFVDSGSISGFTIDKVPRPRRELDLRDSGTGPFARDIAGNLTPKAGRETGWEAGGEVDRPLDEGPAASGPADIVARVEAALDEVRPILERDGGNVTLVAVRAGVAFVRLSGACSGCSAASLTLKTIVEQTIGGAVPEITGAVLVP